MLDAHARVEPGDVDAGVLVAPGRRRRPRPRGRRIRNRRLWRSSAVYCRCSFDGCRPRRSGMIHIWMNCIGPSASGCARVIGAGAERHALDAAGQQHAAVARAVRVLELPAST